MQILPARENHEPEAFDALPFNEPIATAMTGPAPTPQIQSQHATYTVLETGSALRIAAGEWRDPNAAQTGIMRDAWATVGGSFNPGFRAREWDVFSAAEVPVNVRAAADRAWELAEQARRRRMGL